VTYIKNFRIPFFKWSAKVRGEIEMAKFFEEKLSFLSNYFSILLQN
jgi:hypothetical protein